MSTNGMILFFWENEFILFSSCSSWNISIFLASRQVMTILGGFLGSLISISLLTVCLPTKRLFIYLAICLGN